MPIDSNKELHYNIFFDKDNFTKFLQSTPEWFCEITNRKIFDELCGKKDKDGSGFNQDYYKWFGWGATPEEAIEKAISKMKMAPTIPLPPKKNSLKGLFG